MMKIRWVMPLVALASVNCGDMEPPRNMPDARLPPDAQAPPDATMDHDQDGVADADDCAPDDVTRWRVVPLHRDADGDGVGEGAAEDTCMGADIPTGFAALDGDCAPEDASAWQSWSYLYRDVDGDSFTVAEAGAVCAGASLPVGYSLTPSGADCDDADPLRWVNRAGYVDDDGDGIGAGPVQTLCSGASLPAGYAVQGTDCAPLDPARWQLLAFTHRDADGDGHTVAESGTVCSGANLPPGYTNTAQGNDCDDGDPAVFIGLNVYDDGDGDGVGAGAVMPACTDGSVPAGFALTGTDCAPADASAWQLLAYAHIDRDGDGVTVPLAGTICAGAVLPDPYRTTASGNDCDDNDPTLTRFVVLYADQDGDGVGAPPRSIACLGASLPAGFSMLGYDPDDSDPSVTRDRAQERFILGLLP